MSVWGTFILDLFAAGEAREVRDALEELLGPESQSAWATGGVYVFWDPDTREPLYVGITGDLPVRFAQHLGLRAARAKTCKREQIAAWFEEGHERIGYTVIALSGHTQQATVRQRAVLGLEERDLIELNEDLGKQAEAETRALEGRLIAAHVAKTGSFPRWNEDPGQIPHRTPLPGDGTLALATGEIELLLQARRTIRGLAADGLANLYEEQLHGPRMLAVAGISRAGGISDEAIRAQIESFDSWPEMRDEILASGYLDQPCPFAAGTEPRPSGETTI